MPEDNRVSSNWLPESVYVFISWLIVAAIGSFVCILHYDFPLPKGVKLRFVLPQPINGKVSLRVGDFVDIACEPYGYPLPVLIGWTKGSSDELIGQNDCDKRVLSSSSGGGLHLFIESLLKSDIGDYFCLAKAGSKSVKETITLQESEKYNPGMWS